MTNKSTDWPLDGYGDKLPVYFEEEDPEDWHSNQKYLKS